MSPLICLTVLLALFPMDQQTKSTEAPKAPSGKPAPPLHEMAADDTCRNRVNKPITLRRGEKVEVIRTVQPSHPSAKSLPPNDPLSMKVNLTYVRAASGPNAGEYCWVATVHVR